MKIRDKELPDAPLWSLRALLGDKRVDELGAIAAKLYRTQARSPEELVCLAEHLRLFAEVEAWKEGGAKAGEEL